MKILTKKQLTILLSLLLVTLALRYEADAAFMAIVMVICGFAIGYSLSLNKQPATQDLN